MSLFHIDIVTAALVASGSATVAQSSGSAEAGASPIVAIPDQPSASLQITVGKDGVGRNCQVLSSAGDRAGEALACRYFSRGGHDVRLDQNGQPVEYVKKFGVTLGFLRQLEQAR